MSITLTKIESKNVKAFNARLKGVQITKVVENTNDFRSIEFKDQLSGEVFQVTMSPYSDFSLYATKPPQMKKVWVLTGKVNGCDITYKADTKSECEIKSTNLEVLTPIISEVEEEVQNA